MAPPNQPGPDPDEKPARELGEQIAYSLPRMTVALLVGLAYVAVGYQAGDVLGLPEWLSFLLVVAGALVVGRALRVVIWR